MKKILLTVMMMVGFAFAGTLPCKNIVAHKIQLLQKLHWLPNVYVCSYGIQVIAGIADKPFSPQDDPVRESIAKKAKNLLERARSGDKKAIAELRGQLVRCEKTRLPVPKSFIFAAYSPKELFGSFGPDGVYKPFVANGR